MKVAFAGILVLSFVSLIHCEGCPVPTQEQQDCFETAVDPTNPATNQEDLIAFGMACSSVNFTAVEQGDVS